MNAHVHCEKFERDGVLSIERGAQLDPHFAACPDCKEAVEKYGKILEALPLAAPKTRAPIGWQARVLQKTQAAEAATRETRTGMPEALGFVLAAAMLAVAWLGASRDLPGEDVDATADVHAKPETPVVVESPIGPDPDRSGLPEDEAQKPLQKTPAPVAPAPRMPRKEEAPPMRAAPEEMRNAPSPAKAAPLAAGPDTAPMDEAAAKAPGTAHKVERPKALYGFHLDYPRAAIDQRIEGETSVQCTIRSDGRNTNCRVLKSLPFLDEPVLRALAASRSDPIKVDGRPVDNSDHIWHISFKFREPTEHQTTARGVPIVTWKNSAP
jgi:protein TonB